MGHDDRIASLSKHQRFLPLVRHLAYKAMVSYSISRQEEAARLFTLRSILKETRNLRSLTLRVNWWYGQGASYAADLRHFPYLKSLKISAADFTYKRDNGDTLALVSRLEELYLTTDAFFKGCNESNLPPLTVWKMSRLGISHEDMPMLRYCPRLRELEIKLDPALIKFPPQAMMACPDLEVLKLTAQGQNSGPVFRDLTEAFRSLKHLKTLVFPVRYLDQIESLCLAEDDQDASRSGDIQVLPALEHLEMSDVLLKLNVALSDHLHKLLVNILRTRPLLKAFVFPGHEVKPWQLFAQPGLESHREWRCMALETLDLHFTWRLYTRPLEERCEQWRSVFRQIGKLPKLKSLSILCDGLVKSIDAGILELGGARSLSRLELYDRQRSLWTKEEVVTLLQVAPGLVSLSLPHTSNPKQIADWIKEAGRDFLL
ncbi:hypothetical protein BGZ70_005805 [Mortierella alpina]|uniref:F-box protein n=1 Tax=Mortierella alpina TaxID=64518 RepID=A0A9P6JBY7_MORAP|nr:hypothetical protein BGZ70_005805 [Mortierella alpina]